MSRGTPLDRLEPVPWRDFVLGFEAAAHALDHPPEDGTPGVAPPDAVAVVVAATRGALGEGYPHEHSFVHRFFALVDLMRTGRLDAWVEADAGGPGASRLHPALLLAAAEHRLNRNGKLPARRFLERVERIAREAGPGPDAS